MGYMKSQFVLRREHRVISLEGKSVNIVYEKLVLLEFHLRNT
jgi:hypothetical protein